MCAEGTHRADAAPRPLLDLGDAGLLPHGNSWSQLDGLASSSAHGAPPEHSAPVTGTNTRAREATSQVPAHSPMGRGRLPARQLDVSAGGARFALQSRVCARAGGNRKLTVSPTRCYCPAPETHAFCRFVGDCDGAPPFRRGFFV